MSLYLCAFGAITYFIIPLSILLSNFGVLFMTMNFILLSVVLGAICLFTIILPAMQRGVLQLLLICRPSDRVLSVIIYNRLESGKERNLKIALLVTCSIGFIVMNSCGILSNLAYFKGVWGWYMAGDLGINSFHLGSHLNEVPMAKLLDSYMTGDNPAVASYSFTTASLEKMIGKRTFLRDISSNQEM